ncbi:hypothetical protein LEMA_P053730.1 [Plenodomus lingam JN3]|uniref:Kinase n=1 Tax=Leptosphaeria maculans (strain JN3 / isolate v23.1.3 / race Av1-4-5-6-7-8) TaxID=985895 RepID=E4ZN64_LEPMJ|nr:hypothetical protein LEMA_P053730.1 [Plenodomus lingam JN3]CBX92667.1 hypothetical protein LEMA_P053730.1 [Plenodomus lingam JN3]
MSSQPNAQRNASPTAPVRSNALEHPAHGPSTPTADREPVTRRHLSHTGRSKTAPITQENNLWKSSVDRPQLSERDSIFATTYLAADSPGSSPRPSARTPETTNDASEHRISDRASPVPPQRRLIDPPIARRKQSTFAPSTPMDPQTLLATAFNPQPAMAAGAVLQDLHHSPPPYMSPVDSPLQRPVTPHHPDMQSTLHEALLENEERWRNREWREGKPVPFKGSNALQDPIVDIAMEQKMEKKIEATLAKTEPPTAARSRKASHYLRVFKDADNSEDHKKRDNKIKDRRPAERTPSTHPEETSVKEVADMAEQLPPAALASPIAHSPHAVAAESNFEKIPTPRKEGRQTSALSNRDRTQVDQATTSHHELPYRLLEEIRRFGTLSPDTKAGSSVPRSLPASAVEKLDAHVSAREIAPHHEEESVDYFQAKEDEGAERSPASEEEDSEREQISSALYFPHRRIKNSEPTVADQQDSVTDVNNARKRASIHETKVPKGWATEEQVQTPQEVEISLQSQDTNQCLHGDIPTAAPVQQDDDVQPLTSANVDALSAESDYESLAESTHSLLGYESSATDDLGTTPTATNLKQEPKAVLAPQSQPPAPLGAVELKPYDHQVGGHSTVYRFSRRAVCKQLNNRENEFYETIERQHPELLEFLPRYIGVLNVTYRKAPKKKKIAKDKSKADNAPTASASESNATSRQQSVAPSDRGREDQPRVVSHSQQITAVPQVVFENNRHIIPENLFRLPPRSTTPDPWMRNAAFSSQYHRRNQSDFVVANEGQARPPLQHHNSLGVTTINKKLQEEVLRQVFAPPQIHHRQRHHRHHHGIPSRRAGAESPQSMAGSVPNIRRNSTDVSGPHAPVTEESTRKQVLKAEAHRQVSRESDYIKPGSFELSTTKKTEMLQPPAGPKSRRRHSGSGLTRRPLGIDSGRRHNLEYYEEDGYGGDAEEEVFAMDELSSRLNSDTNNPLTNGTASTDSGGSSEKPAEGTMLPAPIAPKQETVARPVEETPVSEEAIPKETEFQRDERVQQFILMEDLTAGMSKPCVLDLKMGTRQYGVEADEKKQRSQRRKCQMTTSRELGVRVCGMQIWNVKTQSYVFEDKYFGRDLKAGKEFQDALKRFFWDGTGYKAATRHIPVILDKISQLERMIRQLPGYRFYASSLLMLYDRGDGESKDKDGLRPAGSEHGSAAPSGPGSPGPAPTPSSLSKSYPEIKLKIVDFANCVTAEDPLPEDLPCPPQSPDGVDRGYLRGLRSLRLYFQRIWQDTCEEWVERGEGDGMVRTHHHGPGLGEVGGGWMDDTGSEDTGYVSF